jgi:DNA polymerase-3 subunit epsilon
VYAIVDIETTGGSATYSRITEIAVYVHDGRAIVREFQTLINPQRPIPPAISRLTGITDEMVAEAPSFREVAEQLEQLTTGCVFVAHNVNFDYNFIREEFKRLGLSYRRRKLCTVRLSRKLLPGKFSYSLGRLCASESIPLHDRHRAAGDAKATAILFGRLLKLDTEGFMEKALKPQSLEAILPPHLNPTDFISLPESQGIYYLMDRHKKVVYIGKAKNIKKRVHSHFSGNSNTRSKYHFVKHIHHIDYQLTPSELLMNITEAVEIKKHWPRHNRSMKRVTLNYGLISYLDQLGYKRLLIGRVGKFDKPLITFKSKQEIQDYLRELVVRYELCPRLAGLQPIGSGKCNYIEEVNCKGACASEEKPEDYNSRVTQAIAEKIEARSSFLIEEPLPRQPLKSILLVEKGRLKGYGIVEREKQFEDLPAARSMIKSVYDDQDLAILLHAYLNKTEAKNIRYFN